MAAAYARLAQALSLARGIPPSPAEKVLIFGIVIDAGFGTELPIYLRGRGRVGSGTIASRTPIYSVSRYGRPSICRTILGLHKQQSNSLGHGEQGWLRI